MEKLTSKKFSDVKLEDKKLQSIHGGNHPSCTGGGFTNIFNNQGQVIATVEYDSDTEMPNGQVILHGRRVVPNQ